MVHTDKDHRLILRRIARRVMLERGLLPDFSKEAIAELDTIRSAAIGRPPEVRDLRSLLWCSIDNDDSRDLDQLTVAESMQDGSTKIRVAVADVDAIVRSGSAIDGHAKHNTTSVYTDALIFPMLPEKLSTDLTSLNLDEDRIAIVVEMVVSSDGMLKDGDICRAAVSNKAKLAYNSVAAWLEDAGPLPEEIGRVEGLAGNLRMQDQAAQKMKAFRHEHGALNFETIQTRALFDGDEIRDLEEHRRNRAKDIIEDFMVAANGVTARFLASRTFPSLRRVVRTPKRWERIVEVAEEHDYTLPRQPDSKALEQFLIKAKGDDPVRFPDLSLTIIKLMGAGEYVAEFPGETAPGHFGLAVKDYSHSTAPNRRYPDLVTHRLLKAALSGKSVPYLPDELEGLARHCTEQEDAAVKVERQVGKSAAALLLEPRIGETFDGIVTGAAAKGTWVRIFHPPVEGKLVEGFKGADVGHKVRVQLVHTDVDKGFIDFKKIRPRRRSRR
ncbi:MAG: RNB domain-containing ribonuclease [Nitrospirae bacterium]|nr:RNB domain-containing ribonuclease [Nitrospirota bacterium]